MTLNGSRRLTRGEGALGGTPTNGTFVVLDVTVAVTEGSASANPLYWRAQSPDGRTYHVDRFAVDGVISSGQISAGRQLRGNIAFDVPAGPLTVGLTTPFGDPVATFAIAR